MKHALLILALAPLASCGISTPDFGNVVQVNFSTEFTETTVHQGATTVTCTDTYTLTGTLQVLVNEASGNTLDGEGKITAGQAHVSSTGAGCASGPGRSNGPSSADLAGTPTQATWSVQSTTTTPFALMTRFSYAGTINKAGGTGVLTFTQTGSGVDESNIPTTSSAQATINVTLH